MKKKTGWFLIIMAFVGTGIKIFNGTGEPMVNIGENEIELQSITLVKNLNKEYRDRDLFSDSLWIDFHCSATTEDYKVNNMAIWHVDGRNWPGLGYHALIRNTGDLYIGNHLEKITYHNAGENTGAIGVCFIGDFDDEKIDDEAIETAKILVDAMCLNLKIKGIRGHCDNPNTTKTCPGVIGYLQLIDEGIITHPNQNKLSILKSKLN